MVFQFLMALLELLFGEKKMSDSRSEYYYEQREKEKAEYHKLKMKYNREIESFKAGYTSCFKYIVQKLPFNCLIHDQEYEKELKRFVYELERKDNDTKN